MSSLPLTARDLRSFAVVICFHPDAVSVARFCEEVTAGGSRVVLVDNTEPGGSLEQLRGPACDVITLGRNTGIAHAQNAGIRHAIAEGAEVVVLFDQDSKIERGFIAKLTAGLRPGEARIVAPVVTDEASGSEIPATRLSAFGLPIDVYTADQTGPRTVDVVIASGTAATREAFQLAGPMDEELFIDYVDTEWCLRCRRRGIPIEVLPSSTMRHSIGSGGIRRGGILVLKHDPARCYYQVRNGLLLFRRRHVPLLFALRENAAVLWSRLLLILHVEGRKPYLGAIAAGLWDGIRGVGGKRTAP